MSLCPLNALLPRTSSRLWRCCLVWVLCLCAWRAPVPVVHCHALESQAQPEADGDWHLMQHLTMCHAGHHVEGDSGWHLHFIMPLFAAGTDADHLPVCLDDLINQHSELQATDWQMDSDVPMIRLVEDTHQWIFTVPNQPALSPAAPKLIPLAPPRSRPTRVSPRIYYCVAQC